MAILTRICLILVVASKPLAFRSDTSPESFRVVLNPEDKNGYLKMSSESKNLSENSMSKKGGRRRLKKTSVLGKVGVESESTKSIGSQGSSKRSTLNSNAMEFSPKGFSTSSNGFGSVTSTSDRTSTSTQNQIQETPYTSETVTSEGSSRVSLYNGVLRTEELFLRMQSVIGGSLEKSNEDSDEDSKFMGRTSGMTEFVEKLKLDKAHERYVNEEPNVDRSWILKTMRDNVLPSPEFQNSLTLVSKSMMMACEEITSKLKSSVEEWYQFVDVGLERIRQTGEFSHATEENALELKQMIRRIVVDHTQKGSLVQNTSTYLSDIDMNLWIQVKFARDHVLKTPSSGSNSDEFGEDNIRTTHVDDLVSLQELTHVKHQILLKHMVYMHVYTHIQANVLINNTPISISHLASFLNKKIQNNENGLFKLNTVFAPDKNLRSKYKLAVLKVMEVEVKLEQNQVILSVNPLVKPVDVDLSILLIPSSQNELDLENALKYSGAKKYFDEQMENLIRTAPQMFRTFFLLFKVLWNLVRADILKTQNKNIFYAVPTSSASFTLALAFLQQQGFARVDWEPKMKTERNVHKFEDADEDYVYKLSYCHADQAKELMLKFRNSLVTHDELRESLVYVDNSAPTFNLSMIQHLIGWLVLEWRRYPHVIYDVARGVHISKQTLNGEIRVEMASDLRGMSESAKTKRLEEGLQKVWPGIREEKQQFYYAMAIHRPSLRDRIGLITKDSFLSVVESKLDIETFSSHLTVMVKELGKVLEVYKSMPSKIHIQKPILAKSQTMKQTESMTASKDDSLVVPPPESQQPKVSTTEVSDVAQQREDLLEAARIESQVERLDSSCYLDPKKEKFVNKVQVKKPKFGMKTLFSSDDEDDLEDVNILAEEVTSFAEKGSKTNLQPKKQKKSKKQKEVSNAEVDLIMKELDKKQKETKKKQELKEAQKLFKRVEREMDEDSSAGTIEKADDIIDCESTDIESKQTKCSGVTQSEIRNGFLRTRVGSVKRMVGGLHEKLPMVNELVSFLGLHREMAAQCAFVLMLFVVWWTTGSSSRGFWFSEEKFKISSIKVLMFNASHGDSVLPSPILQSKCLTFVKSGGKEEALISNTRGGLGIQSSLHVSFGVMNESSGKKSEMQLSDVCGDGSIKDADVAKLCVIKEMVDLRGYNYRQIVLSDQMIMDYNNIIANASDPMNQNIMAFSNTMLEQALDMCSDAKSRSTTLGSSSRSNLVAATAAFEKLPGGLAFEDYLKEFYKNANSTLNWDVMVVRFKDNDCDMLLEESCDLPIHHPDSPQATSKSKTPILDRKAKKAKKRKAAKERAKKKKQSEDVEQDANAIKSEQKMVVQSDEIEQKKVVQSEQKKVVQKKDEKKEEDLGKVLGWKSETTLVNTLREKYSRDQVNFVGPPLQRAEEMFLGTALTFGNELRNVLISAGVNEAMSTIRRQKSHLKLKIKERFGKWLDGVVYEMRDEMFEGEVWVLLAALSEELDDLKQLKLHTQNVLEAKRAAAEVAAETILKGVEAGERITSIMKGVAETKEALQSLTLEGKEYAELESKVKETRQVDDLKLENLENLNVEDGVRCLCEWIKSTRSKISDVVTTFAENRAENLTEDQNSTKISSNTTNPLLAALSKANDDEIANQILNRREKKYVRKELGDPSPLGDSLIKERLYQFGPAYLKSLTFKVVGMEDELWQEIWGFAEAFEGKYKVVPRDVKILRFHSTSGSETHNTGHNNNVSNPIDEHGSESTLRISASINVTHPIEGLPPLEVIYQPKGISRSMRMFSNVRESIGKGLTLLLKKMGENCQIRVVPVFVRCADDQYQTKTIEYELPGSGHNLPYYLTLGFEIDYNTPVALADLRQWLVFMNEQNEVKLDAEAKNEAGKLRGKKGSKKNPKLTRRRKERAKSTESIIKLLDEVSRTEKTISQAVFPFSPDWIPSQLAKSLMSAKWLIEDLAGNNVNIHRDLLTRSNATAIGGVRIFHNKIAGNVGAERIATVIEQVSTGESVVPDIMTQVMPMIF